METTVLYPTIGLGVGFLNDPDYAAAFCRAYNNYVSEEFCKVSPRLKAVALLPLQAPEESAKEMRRAVQDLGLAGGMLAADGPYLLGKPQYDALYQVAQELDSPLAVHASGSLKGRGADEYLFERLVQAHCLSHTYGLMRQMTSMLFDGVPERFPDLKLAYLEAGCTWIPYWMDRMDEEYEIRGEVEAPSSPRNPVTILSRATSGWPVSLKSACCPKPCELSATTRSCSPPTTPTGMAPSPNPFTSCRSGKT